MVKFKARVWGFPVIKLSLATGEEVEASASARVGVPISVRVRGWEEEEECTHVPEGGVEDTPGGGVTSPTAPPPEGYPLRVCWEGCRVARSTGTAACASREWRSCCCLLWRDATRRLLPRVADVVEEEEEEEETTVEDCL